MNIINGLRMKTGIISSTPRTGNFKGEICHRNITESIEGVENTEFLAKGTKRKHFRDEEINTGGNVVVPKIEDEIISNLVATRSTTSPYEGSV